MWNKECGKHNRKIGEIESLFSTKARGELVKSASWSLVKKYSVRSVDFASAQFHKSERLHCKSLYHIMSTCRPLPLPWLKLYIVHQRDPFDVSVVRTGTFPQNQVLLICVIRKWRTFGTRHAVAILQNKCRCTNQTDSDARTISGAPDVRKERDPRQP